MCASMCVVVCVCDRASEVKLPLQAGNLSIQRVWLSCFGKKKKKTGQEGTEIEERLIHTQQKGYFR